MSKAIYGKVIEVQLDTNIKKQDGGTYKGYRLTYKTDDGDIQKVEKANQSLTFGAGPVVKGTLKELQVGDDFSMFLEKNDKGYLDVVGLVKGRDENAVAEAALNQAPSVQRNSSTSGSKVVSTYETPDERKLKQRLIVRQAALNQALELYSVNNAKAGSVSVDNVKDTAQQFEDWVYRGL